MEHFDLLGLDIKTGPRKQKRAVSISVLPKTHQEKYKTNGVNEHFSKPSFPHNSFKIISSCLRKGNLLTEV